MEKGLTKQQVLTELTKSPHADPTAYIPVCREAAKSDPEFMAHLIRWNDLKGSVRDAKLALPLISLSVPQFREPEFVENSLAHLAQLTPRELLKAYKFAQGYVREKSEVPNPDPATAKRHPKIRLGGPRLSKRAWKRYRQGSLLADAQRTHLFERLIVRYLKSREANPAEFERNVLNFRRDMIALYRLLHIPMSDLARQLLHNKTMPFDSALLAVQQLANVEPKEAAALIMQYRIPFLNLFPILKTKVKDPVLLMAIIERMSPTDLQTQMANLERLGVRDFPETRASLEQALTRLETSKRTVLKGSRAVEKIQDEKLREKVKATSERQISNLRGIDGNWLVLGDASSSMGAAVETAKLVAGLLARFVKNQVALVFFNDSPRYFDVTGKSLEEIQQICKYVRADGWTSIGCGLRAALDKKLDIHGIAVISDGGENKPPRFVDQYRNLLKQVERDVPVYYYHISPDRVFAHQQDTFLSSMAKAGYDLTMMDLSGGIDEYSVTNLVQTMRVNRYDILSEVLDTRLITVDEVLGLDGKTEVLNLGGICA